MPVPFADIVGLKHVPTEQRRKAKIAWKEQKQAEIASKEKRRKAAIASKKYRDNKKWVLHEFLECYVQ